MAVVVAHNEHLRGVGTALLRQLAEIATKNGLHHLFAEVLAENHLMLGWRPRRLALHATSRRFSASRRNRPERDRSGYALMPDRRPVEPSNHFRQIAARRGR